MAKIKRVGIVSFGKFFAIVGFFNGVFSAVFYMIISSLANSLWKSMASGLTSQIPKEAIAAGFSQPEVPAQILPSLGVLGFIVVVIASTILGFVMGILIAMNYNTISKLTGGLEIEIE